MKKKNRFKNILSYFISPVEDNYREVSNEEYLESFGLERNEEGDFYKPDRNGEMIAEAYKRACENRDFEINKFWTRAAYFWGFIVLIFGAYFSIIAEKDLDKVFSINIQTCLLCMGLVFSLSWHLVIRGSKHWQENWEQQIDRLENFISGPLYKTIYYKKPFYSVSKINQILSVYVFFIWLFLFVNHGVVNDILNDVKIWFFIVVTTVFGFILCFGYSRKSFSNKKHNMIRRK